MILLEAQLSSANHLWPRLAEREVGKCGILAGCISAPSKIGMLLLMRKGDMVIIEEQQPLPEGLLHIS